MKKTNVAKAQGLNPSTRPAEQDGKDANGFESFDDGIFRVLDLSFFHFQDGLVSIFSYFWIRASTLDSVIPRVRDNLCR